MSTELTPVAQVCTQIGSDAFRQKIGQALPPGVSLDRFTRTALTAIQMNPKVTSADRQSLYNSVIRAAQDGLMPDGREGVLVIYSEWNGSGYSDKVQFQPMVGGVIKRFGDAGILAYAESVYSKDVIRIWNDDTGQHVTHEPDVFGDRGDFIGVYAVGRTRDGRTYVQSMNVAEIDRVKAASKSKDKKTGEPKGPWKDWPDRMAQKSVLHRLGRRMPIQSNDNAAELLASTLDADRELYDFDGAPTVAPTAAPTDGPRRPRALQAVSAAQQPQREPVTLDGTADPAAGDPAATDEADGASAAVGDDF